jgi:ATP-dependent DNA helicase RecG
MKKDIFTEEYLAQIGLNERQRLALSYVREHGEITNNALQQIASVSRRTATYDLFRLVKVGVLKLQGSRKATRYTLNPIGHRRITDKYSGNNDEKV